MLPFPRELAEALTGLSRNRHRTETLLCAWSFWGGEEKIETAGSWPLGKLSPLALQG